ncbi:hypothetical protein BYT27DRAFT_7254907 [Phlegmacium glaucopus]|nr:hypothetical protein BYT27DRAFT_7254907 [Phlegmacium glaucopus]
MDCRIGNNNNMQVPTTSAFVTGLYGIIRDTPHVGILVGTAAVNSGITAALGIREFGISPILTHVAPWRQYVHRRRELGISDSLDDVPSFEKLSWSDLRANRLLDSALAGAVTVLQAGRHAIVSGAITASAVCTLLQYACNELGIARLRYISTLQEENKLQPSPKAHNGRHGKQVYEPSGSVFQQLLKAVGLIPVSDEEYLVKLKRTREVYLKRMVELEQQVEEEKTSKVPRS